MPSQKPVIIPPNAILDPDVCVEFGRPAFAWHAQAGRVAAGGGGALYNKGYEGRIGVIGADANNKWQDGGFYCASAAGVSAADFGTVCRFDRYVSFWCYGKPLATGVFNQVLSNCASTALNGWEFQISNDNTYRFQVAASSVNRFISSETIITTVQTVLGSAQVGGPFLGVWRNGIALANTGATTAATPAYASNFVMGKRGGDVGSSPSNFLFFGVLAWNRPQGSGLARLLDADPDLVWWWPGKDQRRTFIVEGSPAAGRLIYVPKRTPVSAINWQP